MRDWPKKFFNPAFYNPASPAAVRVAPSEVVFMAKALGLKKGMKLLDLCCGPGRHSLAFAARGIAVTGLDFSLQYLAMARRLAQKKRLPARFVRGDMRRLKYRAEFDAVLNAFSSFGYFSKAEDLRVLKGIARALKPGGVVLLDMMDKAWLEKNFRPKSWDLLEDGSYLLTEDTYDRKTASLHGSWTVLHPGRLPQSRDLRLNLYDEKSLGSLLRRAGLTPVKRWSALSFKPRLINNRLVMLARKPLVKGDNNGKNG